MQNHTVSVIRVAFVMLVSYGMAEACSPSRFAPNVEKEERAEISKETVILDIQENMVDSMELSQIVKDVEYVSLESAPEGIMSVPMNVKCIGDLYYVSDIDEHLFCFEARGHFLRRAFRNGKGKGEVMRMYDFDTDRNFLYILDGVLSRLLTFTHEGRFVSSRKLPFRALRFMKTGQGYIFQLAPYALKGKDDPAQVVLTDAGFKVKCKYSRYNVSSCNPVTRTPYFSRCGSRIAFAPVFGRSLYDIKENNQLAMRYYYEYPGDYYEPSKAFHGAEEAARQNILYTYENAIMGEDYLIQSFVTSRNFKGTLFVNNATKACLFVKRLIQDRDDVYRFDFISTKSYDPQHLCYIGFAERYYSESDDDVKTIRRVCNDSVSSLLVSDKEPFSENPLIIRYRLWKDIRRWHHVHGRKRM